MMIENSYQLFMKLKEMNLLKDQSWCPNLLSFEVVVGVILTQNTKWENVEKSLHNLRVNAILTSNSDESLMIMANSDPVAISSHIISSGFFRQKSMRLVLLSRSILEDFGNFADFCLSVDREWLLKQKGIGKESADSILNYACGRPVMVVDKYTQRLLKMLGYEFDDYDYLQDWLQNGIKSHISLLQEYGQLYEIFAHFHGMIVEFSKRKLVFQ